MTSTLLRPTTSITTVAALPTDPALIDEDRRFATTYDQLQPCFVDYAGFAKTIVEISTRYRTRARMIELGCGTGLLAAEVLSAGRHVDYRGFDASVAMGEIFARRAISLERHDRGVAINAPVDLRLKASLASALRGETAEIVLMSQFLQAIPVRVSDVLSDRAGMIEAARAAIRGNGKIVIIEEVFGESLEEHRRFAQEWDRFAIRRISDSFYDIRAALNRVDPALLDVLVALPGRPSLVQIVREQLWRSGEPQLLPLSSWCRLFELMRLRYRAIPHETLKNFYMFVIDA